jgi:LIM homeobox protein 2/9
MHDSPLGSCSTAAAGGGYVEPAVCAGCGCKIADRYFLQAVERQWHAACLRCADCHLPLDAQLTCFARDGQIFCKDDYHRLVSMWIDTVS